MGEAATRENLLARGIQMPGPHRPPHPLVAVVRHGDRARTSGQLPRVDGQLLHPGRLGAEVDTAQGQAAARACALNALALLEADLGGLDRVARVLSVLVFVACTPDFAEQPAVADGASQLLLEVFGEQGVHTRSAIGVAALPRGACVEVEVEVALRVDGSDGV